MTDSSGLWGDWRVVLAGCLSVLSASVATIVVRTGDPATADTYLSAVRVVAVTLADGTQVAGRDGMRVPEGATVRTGAGGGAVLETAGRDVYVGALSTVRVVDGVQQELTRGQVMVDGRDGPRLALASRAGMVAVDDGALARVELGPVLRLGVFAGSSSFTAAGRRATVTVPRWYQVQVPYGGLPGARKALALTGDTWEQRLVADLVAADRDLNALARGLAGADGLRVLSAAPVALRSVTPTTLDRGEQALAVAVAQTARRSASAADNLATVRTARGEGGSWGVVAAIVESRVSAVSALLDEVLAPPGTTPPALAGSSPLSGFFGPRPASEPSAGSSRGPSPTRKPSPRPSTSVSPTSTPSAVDEVIKTVTGILGSPSPTPSPTRSASVPLPG